MPISAAEQVTAEKRIYGHNYAGYKRDARLDANFDNLIEDYILPRLPENGVVLDVGCGAGAFLAAAARAGIAAKGLEVSEDAAKICRAAGCDADSGDFLTYGKPKSFDIITMWDVLEHLRDPGAFVRRARELLTDTGVLVAKVPTYGDLSVYLADRFARARGALLGAPGHIQYYTPSSLGTLLANNGADVERSVMLRDGIRTPPTGGRLKTRIVRKTKAVIASLSGESNVLVIAR